MNITSTCPSCGGQKWARVAGPGSGPSCERLTPGFGPPRERLVPAYDVQLTGARVRGVYCDQCGLLFTPESIGCEPVRVGQ